MLACWAINETLAKIFNAQTNVESPYITGLILALILTPAKTPHDYIFLFVAAALALASKFILAIGKKHIFNPAAIAIVITAFTLNQYASWWVGTAWMLPLVIVTGILITKKIQRSDLVFTFLAIAIVTSLTLGFLNNSSVITIVKEAILDSPLFFFAFIMLTEPLTAPPTKGLQIFYGAIVGFLFAPQAHIASIYFTPELALVTGNIFSYLVSPKQKLLLTLKEKIQLAPDIYDFIFTADKKSQFKPGQYLEWTLGHKGPDNRGNRRYFTIASSPTEQEIILGVRFYEPSSTFKKSLLAMQPGQSIMAGQLAGDFVLPKEKNQKLVFFAGGIGVTPFRSMVKYLIDKKEKRDITIFYANRTPQDVVYKDIFDQAEKSLGIKTIYTVSKNNASANWKGETGYITEQMIKEKLPDYKDRMFYLSGPRSMITSFEQTLRNMGIKNSHIKTDFFPGFA